MVYATQIGIEELESVLSLAELYLHTPQYAIPHLLSPLIDATKQRAASS